jgi:hypothetical protein
MEEGHLAKVGLYGPIPKWVQNPRETGDLADILHLAVSPRSKSREI